MAGMLMRRPGHFSVTIRSMANVLVLRPEQYLQGVVTLYRGDEWNLDFQLNNRVGGVDLVEDLSAASGVTGYFPGTTGALVPVTCVALDAAQGLFRCTVPESITPTVGLVSDGVTWYARASTPSGIQTYVTPDMPLVINDPSFNS